VNPYSYTSDGTQFNLHLKGTSGKWQRYAVDFPSARPTRYEETNTVRGEYFQPREVDNAPLAILLHGVGDQSVIPCRLLARSLVKNGVACFIPYLVVHSSRMPEVTKRRFPLLTAEEWFEGYRISVIEVQQVLDWAGSRAEIDKGKIAVIGISFGGFISAIAMGVDERIGAGVFITMGGNGEKISRQSRRGSIREGYWHTEAEYHQIQKSYTQYLSEVAENGFENVIPVRESFLTDPLTFAHRLRQRPVFMINALWDEAIPKQATLDFWEACNQPDIAWLPATHASIWLWYPLISRKIADFLSSTFNNGE
jgi:cephalosporin-C deacetylase-like acetyl esterase